MAVELVNIKRRIMQCNCCHGLDLKLNVLVSYCIKKYPFLFKFLENLLVYVAVFRSRRKGFKIYSRITRMAVELVNIKKRIMQCDCCHGLDLKLNVLVSYCIKKYPFLFKFIENLLV